MPDGPEKDAALAALAEKDAIRKLRKELEEDRTRIYAMSDGTEKDAAFAAFTVKE